MVTRNLGVPRERRIDFRVGIQAKSGARRNAQGSAQPSKISSNSCQLSPLNVVSCIWLIGR
jgi:hypothetical protein